MSDNCKEKTIEDEDCITGTFENLNVYKSEPKYIQNDYQKRVAEFELKLTAQIGSRFDSWLFFNTLHTWLRKNSKKIARARMVGNLSLVSVKS